MTKEGSAEKLSGPRGLVIFDLDGVVIRWPGHHTVNPSDFQEMGEALSGLQKEGVRVSAITNRPPSEMQPIAYYLGVSEGLWITESGGSVYDVGNNTQVVSPQWISAAQNEIPRLRHHLNNELGLGNPPTSHLDAQYLPGMGYVKTVIVPPRNQDKAEYYSNVLKPSLERGGFMESFHVEVGKGIDIDPIGLSKDKAMQSVWENYGVDPRLTPTIFIADHTRDVAAAGVLFGQGGMVASVANADNSYKSFVSNSGGIVAPENTSYHSSVTHILREFSKRLK